MYGQANQHVSFKIGNAHVSIADDTHQTGQRVRQRQAGSDHADVDGYGRHSTVGGKTLHFWTPPGNYTVLDKANPVVMDSATYGLTGAGAYRTTVPYATRISIDGIYLHQLNDTIWAQGNTNVSHGCLNLSGENARVVLRLLRPRRRRRGAQHRRPPADACAERRLERAVGRVA